LGAPTSPVIGQSGIVGRPTDHHRYMFSQTWLAEFTTWNPFTWTVLMQIVANQLLNPFGNASPNIYDFTRTFIDLLHPAPPVFTSRLGVVQAGATPLNPAAPEASFRLQRVGADGSLGRLAFPILVDDYYLDLPHRRQIDVGAVDAELNVGLRTHPLTFTTAGMTMTNIIWHRSLGTWTNVVSYRLLPNPIRKWQRSRTYPPSAGVRDDGTWHPPYPPMIGH
jgi:hypothetical protein